MSDIAKFGADSAVHIFATNALGVPVPISQGGTGATTAAAALAALGGVGPATIMTARGTGAGNYSTTSTVLTPVDSTNLKLSANVPAGSTAICIATGAIGSSTSAAGVTAAIFVDGLGQQAQSSSAPPAANEFNAFSVIGVVTGDGANHTFELYYQASSPNNAVMQNSNAIALPVMALLILPT